MGDLRLSQHREPRRHLQCHRGHRCIGHVPQRHCGGRLLRLRRGTDRLHVLAGEAPRLEVDHLCRARLRRPVRSTRHRRGRRQDRGHTGARGRKRPLRHGCTRRPHEFDRELDHRAIRDSLPDAARAGSLASRALLPAERPDVRQPPDPGDTPGLDPGPGCPDGPRQLRRQLHHVRHRRWHHLAGGLLVVCRSLGDDGRHEPGTLQHHHDSGGRHHEHLRPGLRVDRRAPASADHRPDRQVGLAPEPEPGCCGRPGRRGQPDPAGLHPWPDSGSRGNGFGPDPPERHDQCDQRCRGDGLPEDQRSVLHDAGHRACSGGGFTERRMDQWRQDCRAGPSGRSQRGRGDVLRGLPPDRVAPLPLLGSQHPADAGRVRNSTDLDPALAAPVRHPQLHGVHLCPARPSRGCRSRWGGQGTRPSDLLADLLQRRVFASCGFVPHHRHSDAGLLSGKQARQLRQRDHGWPAGSAICIPQRECVRRRRRR